MLPRLYDVNDTRSRDVYPHATNVEKRRIKQRRPLRALTAHYLAFFLQF